MSKYDYILTAVLFRILPAIIIQCVHFFCCFKVGSWNTEDGLQLRDIVWPGGLPVPPLGRPEKYHLNIVTLEEEPYVIMKKPGRTMIITPALLLVL